MTFTPTRLAFSIASCGKGSANRLWLFGNQPAPSWDSDSVWVNCWSGFPGTIESSLSFRDGESSTGGMTIPAAVTAKISLRATVLTVAAHGWGLVGLAHQMGLIPLARARRRPTSNSPHSVTS